MTAFGEERDLVQGKLAVRVVKNNKVSRVVRFSFLLSWLPTFNHVVPSGRLKAASPNLGSQSLNGAAE